jgi:hypothetical protein
MKQAILSENNLCNAFWIACECVGTFISLMASLRSPARPRAGPTRRGSPPSGGRASPPGRCPSHPRSRRAAPLAAFGEPVQHPPLASAPRRRITARKDRVGETAPPPGRPGARRADSHAGRGNSC